MARGASPETKTSAQGTKLDTIFEDLDKKDPNHIAVKYWKSFKAADQRIWKRIVITLYVRLAPFAIDYFAAATKDDDLHLQKIKEEKVALFVITPISNDCFNFLAAILYTQFIEMQNKEKEQNRKNNIDLILNDFTHTGIIHELPKQLKDTDKKKINCMMVIRNLNHLKTMYPNDYKKILSQCKTVSTDPVYGEPVPSRIRSFIKTNICIKKESEENHERK